MGMAHFILSIYFPVYLKVIGHEDPVYLLRTGVYFGHPYLPPATQPFRSFFPQRTLTRRDDPKKRAKVNSPKRGFLKTFRCNILLLNFFPLSLFFHFVRKCFGAIFCSSFQKFWISERKKLFRKSIWADSCTRACQIYKGNKKLVQKLYHCIQLMLPTLFSNEWTEGISCPNSRSPPRLTQHFYSLLLL